MIDVKGNVVLVGNVVSLVGDICRFPADNKYIVVEEEVEDGSVILYPYHIAHDLDNLPIWENVALRYSYFLNEGIYLERVLDYDVRVVYNFFRHLGESYLHILQSCSGYKFDELFESQLDDYQRDYLMKQYQDCLYKADMLMYRWSLRNPSNQKYEIGRFIRIVSEKSTKFYLVVSTNPLLGFQFEDSSFGLTSPIDFQNVERLNLVSEDVSCIPEDAECITSTTNILRNSVFDCLINELHYRKNRLRRIGENCALEKHLLNQYTDLLNKLKGESE